MFTGISEKVSRARKLPKKLSASFQRKTSWALEGGWILMIFHSPAIHVDGNFGKTAEPTSLQKNWLVPRGPILMNSGGSASFLELLVVRRPCGDASWGARARRSSWGARTLKLQVRAKVARTSERGVWLPRGQCQVRTCVQPLHETGLSLL